MSTEENQDAGAQADKGAGEGETKVEIETIAVPKADYDKLNETIGSMKRELKDLKKPKEETKETPKTNQTDDSRLTQKAYLRSAGIIDADEVELALSTAKKWGEPIDSIVDDDDFKVKLEKLRTQKTNELAISNVKGSGQGSQAKNTPEYWIAKGIPPSPNDVPDRKTRAKIARAMVSNTKSSKTFYND